MQNARVSTPNRIVIVGGGSGGISVAASLLARQRSLEITIIEPTDVHYYQPGWTMVGGGIFSIADTRRSMANMIPKGVKWVKDTVVTFDPANNSVVLGSGSKVQYDRLIVSPGLKLNWDGVDGLRDSLGSNGVTSNYRYDLAPYTWRLVQEMKAGHAVFTQPGMPIKCAGAPQKAMYLSADHWRRKGRLKDVSIDFCNAGGVLFGVADYVPALMEYVSRYGSNLRFGETLIRVDGPAKTAWFQKSAADGSKSVVETKFDFLHVVPPQTAPDFIRESPLADQAGWMDVDQQTLRHKKFSNIYGLGDVTNTPNAKTVAAARKQGPVVAYNVLSDMGIGRGSAIYDGYGACPLTVERGKIVLAEFCYGGKLAPTFPPSLLKGTRPTRTAWWLKAHVLPSVYWNGMLKGHEWLAKPAIRP
ncbi:Sulfide:quinone oxidoreductase, mitochondrial [Hyphomicrobium sp. GJ21]|uniref:NAD(P)/FAD-dependent oxidoreductase n=1 Tax=Hyphomicrobium sp. GJ21 TaxID=113574 RepID=UPI000622B5A8|nr:Sulfide:quinone oxidoreductase, mitochondrial [Hyphomicrobium sp. GJ21]